MKRFLLTALLAVAVSLLSGCDKRPKGMPPTYPTKITVLKHGEPVVGARVMLYPRNPIASAAIAGFTKEKGIAEIWTTFHAYTGKGAPVGEFDVTITRDQTAEQTKNPEELRRMQVGERLLYAQDLAARTAQLPKLVPPIWGERGMLTLTVAANKKEGANVVFEGADYFDFDTNTPK